MDDLFANQDFENKTKEAPAELAEQSLGQPMPNSGPLPTPQKPEEQGVLAPAPNAPVAVVEQDNRTYKLKQIQLAKTQTQIDDSSFGPLLKQLREEHSLSLEDLAGRTLININYLSALEEQNYEHLPEPVYVAAYIRKLGFIYSLTEEEISRLTAEVKSLICPETPHGDDIEKVVVNYEQSEENARKIRQIIWGASIVFVLVALAVTLGLSMLFSGSPKTSTINSDALANTSSSFDPARLLKVPKKPNLSSTLLDVTR